MSATSPDADAGLALRLRAITKTFGAGGLEVRAADGLDLDIARGGITGLIGPDGAGKTTLMRLATGLLRPDASADSSAAHRSDEQPHARVELRVLGIDVMAEPMRVQETVGYMPQRFGLYEDLSVRRNLELYADLHGVAHTARSSRFVELLELTGLGRFTERLAGRLSGGMKQKLGVACALVRPPPLLLLDEPTVGVDPVSRRDLWSIVQAMARDNGVTVLVSTSYLDEAEHCDDIVLLHRGRVLGQGPPRRFSEAMRGRCFHVSAGSMRRRALQLRLSREPAVLDVVLEGDGARVVTRAPGPLSLPALAAEVAELVIRPVEPRFEDAFIDRLAATEGTDRAPSSLPSAASVASRPSSEAWREQSSTAKYTGRAGGDTAPIDAPVIEVSGLQRRFGPFLAVKGLDFEVRGGEIFGLLGANGAGKSTTFRMLCGLLPASAGKVRVAGLDMRRSAPRARGRLGYMAQRFSMYGDLSVLENLRFFSSAYGLRGQRQQARIDWALATFELEDVQRERSGDLPLGFKQRLAMAAALLHEPEILFLDEPTSGVDALVRREFWRRINALAESGTTILVTTHFMDEANYCDRLVIMADGEVLAAGTPMELVARARGPRQPEPTLEDAFIALISAHRQASEEAA